MGKIAEIYSWPGKKSPLCDNTNRSTAKLSGSKLQKNIFLLLFFNEVSLCKKKSIIFILSLPVAWFVKGGLFCSVQCPGYFQRLSPRSLRYIYWFVFMYFDALAQRLIKYISESESYWAPLVSSVTKRPYIVYGRNIFSKLMI